MIRKWSFRGSAGLDCVHDSLHPAVRPRWGTGAQVCVETGRRLARVAFKRAVALTPVGTPIVGLAATCALVSDSPKRGQHRCYVVAHTATQVRGQSAHNRHPWSSWPPPTSCSLTVRFACAPTGH